MKGRKRAEQDSGGEGGVATMDAPAAAPVVVPGLKVVANGLVVIDDIELNGHNRKHSAESIESMRQSIAANGVLQPVGVVANEGDDGDDARYRLVFGHRRTLAAKAAGLTEIPATVFRPIGEDAKAREAAVQAAVEVENLERVAPDSVQESEGVARLVEAVGIPEAAVRLGRSTSWVRERCYLAGAGPRLRELVACGRLPLLHAREICRNVADQDRQDELAKDYAADPEDGSGVRSIEELRSEVKQCLYSLKVVPWTKDVPTPGVPGAPACDTCECNSANRRGLFDSPGAVLEPEKGDKVGWNGVRQTAQADDGPWCLNGACYEKKRKAVDAAVKKAVAPTVKALDGEGASPKNLTALDLVPKGVEPRVLASAVRSKRQGKGDEKLEKEQPARKMDPIAAKLDEVRRDAEAEHEKLTDAFERALTARLKDVLKDDVFAAAFERVWNSALMRSARDYRPEKREKFGCPPGLMAQIRGLLKVDAKDVAAWSVGIMAEQGRQTTAWEFSQLSTAAASTIFSVLGIEAVRPPDADEFVRAKVDAAKAEIKGKTELPAPVRHARGKRAAAGGEKSVKKKGKAKKKGAKR